MQSTALQEQSLVSRIISDAKSNQHSILEQVAASPLPKSFHSFVLNYEANFNARNRFLWKWVWAIFKNDQDGIMLSSVPSDRSTQCAEIKLLLTMADVIVDDAADQGKDRHLLDALLKIPFENDASLSGINENGRKKVELLKSIFEYILGKFAPMPFWKNFSSIIEFDLKQVWNSCLYSFLLNERPSILNYSESMRFGSFNMMIFLYLDTDLIFSKGIDENEIGAIREITMKTQEMARIGNWVSTWEREVNESDLSSGVFARIVTDGHITADKLGRHLQNADSTTLLMLIKESLVENKLLEEWLESREEALRMARSVKSVDMVKYVKGFDRVLVYHLISTGRK